MVGIKFCGHLSSVNGHQIWAANANRIVVQIYASCHI